MRLNNDEVFRNTVVNKPLRHDCCLTKPCDHHWSGCVVEDLECRLQPLGEHARRATINHPCPKDHDRVVIHP